MRILMIVLIIIMKMIMIIMMIMTVFIQGAHFTKKWCSVRPYEVSK